MVVIILIVLLLFIGTCIKYLAFKNEVAINRNSEIVQVQDTSQTINMVNGEKPKQFDVLKNEIMACLSDKQGDYSIGFCELSNNDYLLINSKKMPSASVIKLYIMVHAFKEHSLKKLDMDDTLIVQQDDKVGGTGSLAGQPTGTKVSIYRLIELMITESDNTATNILIGKLGFKQINQTMQEMGYTDTILQRKMMDFSSIKEGKENYTSVSDLVTLLFKIANDQCIGEPYDQKMLSILKKQKQKTIIPNCIPENYTIANKCGNLPGVVNDAAIIYSEDGGYILCVLSENVPEENARKTIVKISKVAFEYYETVFRDP